ncbi:hypothetical protein CTAYLR_007184 [Chrysophaeum taylorii]|uniref:Uncharacterized protein n=1 Tax=Chrysophaeum taylorii TaxID=2483200 RepID=A0AAD7ULT5_9STRA|nr:hypothetical protein CTAYLR_007184 [Chrysophaeum taylorii]
MKKWAAEDDFVRDVKACARRALRRRRQRCEPVMMRREAALPQKEAVLASSSSSKDVLETWVGGKPPTKFFFPLPKSRQQQTRKPEIHKKLRKSPFYSENAVVLPPVVVAEQQPVVEAERAGPTNWSVDDLRIKYRRGIIPAFDTTIRPKPRRFVLDVHQLWLTNLEHLAGPRHRRCDHIAVAAAKSQIQSVVFEFRRPPSYVTAQETRAREEAAKPVFSPATTTVSRGRTTTPGGVLPPDDPPPETTTRRLVLLYQEIRRDVAIQIFSKDDTSFFEVVGVRRREAKRIRLETKEVISNSGIFAPLRINSKFWRQFFRFGRLEFLWPLRLRPKTLVVEEEPHLLGLEVCGAADLAGKLPGAWCRGSTVFVKNLVLKALEEGVAAPDLLALDATRGPPRRSVEVLLPLIPLIIRAPFAETTRTVATTLSDTVTVPSMLRPNPKTAPLSVAVVRTTANSTSVLGRHARHSDDSCDDGIPEPRQFYPQSSARHRGSNTPTNFVVVRGCVKKKGFAASCRTERKKQLLAPSLYVRRRRPRVALRTASTPTTTKPRIVGVVAPDSSSVPYAPHLLRDSIFLAEVPISSPSEIVVPKPDATEAVLAAKSGNIEKVEDALEQDVFVDQTDKHGNSLLILAAQTNNKRMIKALLRRGANVNFQNALGNTALHYCCEYQYHDLADYLTAKGADTSLLNANGLTCFEGLALAN